MRTVAARLAAVVAHPDDESRIVGGTLALAAARGVEVSVYSATRGEAGDARRTPEATAALRERELRAACETLGVGELWLDDFPDARLANIADQEVLARVVRFLRTQQPHAVITFGPDGRTGHADHVAIGRLAAAAFTAAGDAARCPEHLEDGLAVWQPGWLYHTAVAEGVARQLGWTGPALPDAELVTVDVSPVLDRKQQAAMACHASQWELSPMRLGEGGSWQPWAAEHFRLAQTAEPAGEDPLARLADPRGTPG